MGTLVGRSPRANRALYEGINTLSSGIFAPIFFVLAGMRVDVFELRTLRAWDSVALLLVTAAIAKVVPTAIGARIGGLGRR